MAEYSANAIQTVAPGSSVIFTDAPFPCKKGYVRHRDNTGAFVLSGVVPYGTCPCKNADYKVDFSANIAISTDETDGPISLAFALDGNVLPSTTMIVTPAAVDQYFNVSCAVDIEVWRNCCETFSIINTSTMNIYVQNANVVFDRPDLVVTR